MKQRVLALFCMMLPAITVFGQESGSSHSSYYLNWGLKVGFAATGTYLTEAVIDGHKLSDYKQDTQVGNFAAVQLRLNAKRLLIQTGVSLNSTKSSFSIDKKSWNQVSTIRNEIGCSYSMLSMAIPIQIGYHIINKPPYSMSLFTGPRLRYTPERYYSVTYTNTAPYEFTDTPHELIMGWTAGLSIQIGRTFLDFEYEATINNVSDRMYETSGANPVPDYALDRRISIISFSYGIMF